jgi:hypothetical protein
VKKLFNWILILGGLVGAFYFVGLIVPRQQRLGSYTTLDARPDALYALVSDPLNWPDWHPDFVSVRERPEVDDERRWEATGRDGRVFELREESVVEGTRWLASYELEGTKTTWRFDIKAYAEGSRMGLLRTEDTRDTWLRAKRFLLFQDGASPLAVLNSLSVHLGEPEKAVKDND